MRRYFFIFLAALMLLMLIPSGCATQQNPGGNGENTIIHATITMENGGVIELELYYDIAPQTVANFVDLARSGFYDGLTFHRIKEGFMIQGGCPYGSGSGQPGYSIFGEFTANGFENNLSHTEGVISMARGESFNSAGSQFFITDAAAAYLDGKYAAFGRVTSGMDIVHEIAKTPSADITYKVIGEQPRIRSITIAEDFELGGFTKYPRG